MKHKGPTILVILDGLGYSKKADYNAVAQAHTPHFDSLIEAYPTTLLAASGLAVGLPDGYIGNSSVGHLTIGSGAVLLQPLTMLSLSIQEGSFFTNPILIENLQKLKKENKTLHLLGLLSDAGVHSHMDHLFAFLKAAQQQGLTDVVVHPILDGRDSAPREAQHYLEILEEKIKTLGIGRIGSVHGRFYAMARNKDWYLTEQSYSVLTEPHPITAADWHDALDQAYKKEFTDEYVPPTQLDSSALIKEGDGIIFFNFRADRAQQITACFTNPSVPIKAKKITPSFFITPVSYGAGYNTTALYQRPRVAQTLTQLLHDKGYSLFATAETEKYAHITYFFNGGREAKLPNEKRILVPSASNKDYAANPRMSADTITEVILDSLQNDPRDFYVVNYANADMVGHTGDFEATIKAVECLDEQLGKLYKEVVEKRDGTLYVTADHGNAEEMFDTQTGQPKTAHTTNPVFFIMARQDLKNSHEELPLDELSDIAPFIVHNIEE